jgi:hypothetical protein
MTTEVAFRDPDPKQNHRRSNDHVPAQLLVDKQDSQQNGDDRREVVIDPPSVPRPE